MAAIFRISFDVGAGFVVYTPYENNLTWIKEHVTLAAIRVKIEGGITFVGSEYTTLKNFKDAGNRYVPIKIEQDSAGWNNIFEGVAFLLVDWDENRSIITLNKFVNDNEYDNLLSNYDIKYGFRSLSLTNYEIVVPSTTSTTVDAVSVVTVLNPANYILTYDINGRVIRSGTEPLWALFLFRSTNPDGSHNFETMSFDYDPQSKDYTNIRLLVGGDSYQNLWVKLPAFVGATQSLSDLVATASYRFPDLINALLPIANSSLTFTEATAVTYTGQSQVASPFTQYAWFDYTKYQLAEASDVANLDSKETSLSLKFLFDIMAKCFDLHWYLDGTALKFKHVTELTTSGTLDLSTQTANLKRLEYLETEIPDIEVFTNKDIKNIWKDTGATTEPWGEVQIYYRSGNPELSLNIKRTHDIPVLTNVLALMSKSFVPDNSDHVLIETTDDSTTPRVAFGTNPDWNLRLSTGELYGHLNKWRFGINPDLSTRLKFAVLSLTETQPRPLTKIPLVKYHQDLLTNYDFDRAITTAVGSGKTERITQKLNTDYLEIEVRL